MLACHLGCLPFFPESPTMWTGYVADALLTFWVSLYILGGMVRVLCPKTYAWAERRAQR